MPNPPGLPPRAHSANITGTMRTHSTSASEENTTVKHAADRGIFSIQNAFRPRSKILNSITVYRKGSTTNLPPQTSKTQRIFRSFLATFGIMPKQLKPIQKALEKHYVGASNQLKELLFQIDDLQLPPTVLDKLKNTLEKTLPQKGAYNADALKTLHSSLIARVFIVKPQNPEKMFSEELGKVDYYGVVA